MAGQRQRLGRGRTSCANGAAGAGGVAHERLSLGAALCASREVRQVARDPEQLELEREPERLERRPPVGGMARVVEEVEEARHRGERPLVRLLLAEQAQHRLRADHPHGKAVVVLTCFSVRPDELRCGHRLELAAAAMEDELDV